MTTSLLAVIFDCHDPLRVAQFWAFALDRGPALEPIEDLDVLAISAAPVGIARV